MGPVVTGRHNLVRPVAMTPTAAALSNAVSSGPRMRSVLPAKEKLSALTAGTKGG